MAHRNRNGEKSLTAKLEHLTMSPMHVQPVRAWIDMDPQTRISTMNGQFQEPIKTCRRSDGILFRARMQPSRDCLLSEGRFVQLSGLGPPRWSAPVHGCGTLNEEPSRKFLLTSWLLERYDTLPLACPCARCKSKATPLIVHERCGNP
jgi:hypothetical protein